MFTILYDNRSAPDDSTGYNGGYIACKISGKNGLERGIDRTEGFSFS